MRVTVDHKLEKAVWCESPHWDDRPLGADPEVVVVHCVSLPEGEFGTGAPERLFEGCLDLSEHDSFADLDGVHVAPHLLILRDGAVKQFVEFDKRAWHAGVSSYNGRDLVNDFSIGIELEGSVHETFDKRQYAALHEVLCALLTRYPGLSADRVVGHCEIAPGRKEDPGQHFAWRCVLTRLFAERGTVVRGE